MRFKVGDRVKIKENTWFDFHIHGSVGHITLIERVDVSMDHLSIRVLRNSRSWKESWHNENELELDCESIFEEI